jgi:hypothetical protein
MKRKIKKLRKDISKISDSFLRETKESALNNLEYGLTMELFNEFVPKDIWDYYMKNAYNKMVKIIKPFNIQEISEIMGMIIKRRSSYIKEKRIKIQEIIEDYKSERIQVRSYTTSS